MDATHCTYADVRACVPGCARALAIKAVKATEAATATQACSRAQAWPL